MREFFVYILSNKSQTLYIGVTNDLARRLDEHRAGVGSAFTAKYHCHALVWFERFTDPKQAIAAETKLKGWSRAKKIALIESQNPNWTDLSLPNDPHLGNDCHSAGA